MLLATTGTEHQLREAKGAIDQLVRRSGGNVKVRVDIYSSRQTSLGEDTSSHLLPFSCPRSGGKQLVVAVLITPPPPPMKSFRELQRRGGGRQRYDIDRSLSHWVECPAPDCGGGSGGGVDCGDDKRGVIAAVKRSLK